MANEKILVVDDELPIRLAIKDCVFEGRNAGAGGILWERSIGRH